MHANYLIKKLRIVVMMSCLFLLCSLKIFAGDSVNISDYGVTGDGETDITEKLEQVISDVAGDSTKNAIYFPEGTYIISGKVTLKKGVSLIGDAQGVSVIKCLDGIASIGNSNGGERNINDIEIKDLFFYNVNVQFYCWLLGHRKNIHIYRCVFYGGDDNVVLLSRASESSLRNCIFLRSSQFPGSGVMTWNAANIDVENNVFGLSFANLNWLTTQWKGASTWTNLLGRLHIFQIQEALNDNQGCFRRAIKIQKSRGLVTVRDNILNADRNYNGPRDHAMYIHNNYKKVVIVQNWMRGWVNNPSGGVKVRNNHGPTVIAVNRFKDISIIGYIHRIVGENGGGGYDNQEVYIDTLIYKNIFDFDYDNPCYGGVGMWDQASEKGGKGVESGNEYAENIMNTPNNTASFWFRSADASGYKIYNTNFDGDGNLITSSHQYIPVVSGDPDPQKIESYQNLEAPDLNIPLY